jgi:DNA-binding CsgD family transcriptional regulator
MVAADAWVVPARRPVGRSVPVAAVLEVLRGAARAEEPVHVVVEAGPAAGTTSFLAFVAGTVTADRPDRVLDLHPDPTMRTVPFAGLTGWPGLTGLVPGGARSTRRLDGLVPVLVDRLAEQYELLVVDGLDALDDHAAFVLAGAARRGARLLGATSSRRPLPSPLAALERDGLVRRVRLDPIGDTAVARLAAEVVGGPVEPVLVRAVRAAVGGAPAAIVDVLRAAAAEQAIAPVGRVWRQQQPLPVPATLVDRVARSLYDLDPDDLAAADALALAGRLPLEVAAAVVGDAALDRLERQGVVVVEGGSGQPHVARFVDPAVRTVRAASMSTLRSARIVPELRAALAAWREAPAARSLAGGGVGGAPVGSTTQAGLTALEASLALQAGIVPTADDAVTASRAAVEAGDPVLAEAVCRAALRAGEADVGLVVTLGEILMSLGRNLEAETVLGDVQPGDDQERALVAMARAVNFAFHLDRVHDARSLMDTTLAELAEEAWAAELRGVRGVVELFLGRAAEALASVSPFLDDGSSRQFVEAATAAGPALVVQGRHLDAAELADRALQARLALGDQPLLSGPGLHALVRSLALAEAGEFADADRLSLFVAAAAVEIGDRNGQMWAGVIGGRSLLSQGRFREALQAFETAASAATDLNLVPHLRWARGGAVLAAAQTGDPELTRQMVDALDACPPTELGLMASELERARAWSAIASGDLRTGSDRLLAAADAAAMSGESGLEILALHDLVRIGNASQVDRLDRVASAVQGPLSGLRAAHGRALAAGDVRGLGEVAERFESIGALVFAAEAANRASWAARRAGDPAAAERWRTRVLQLRARRPEADTPALAPHPGFALLTDREREVVALAASGEASKAIAVRLGLSARTVDNHLQRIYRKLGVTSREDLRELRDRRPDRR